MLFSVHSAKFHIDNFNRQRQKRPRRCCVTDFWSEARHGFRLLAKSPGFTIAAIAALALGIGANTAIFSVLNAVLLKPLGYPNEARLVAFMLTTPDEGEVPFASVPNFFLYKQQTRTFQEVGAFDLGGPGFNLTGGRPEQVPGLHVSEGYFRVFGAPVLLGRTFTQEEDRPHGGNVVVLSYGLWQHRYGSDAKIVGTTISLGNEPYTVVGVLGKHFVSDPQADLWVPFQFDPNSTDQGHYFEVAGLLRPGVTLAQADAQMKAASSEFHHMYPLTWTQLGFAVEPLRQTIIGDVGPSLLVMLTAVGLVLLIACSNVANLLLVRATGRQREFAIRLALGARPRRIVRQLLTESGMLAIAGGAAGIALGFGGVKALLTISPAGLPRTGENGAAVGLDWRVLGFALGVSALTGILFGLFPALAASRANLNLTLKEGGGRLGTGLRQGRIRSVLVVSEVSLAVVLLVGAGLLIRSFIALRGVDPGFLSRHVLTMEMSLNGSRFEKAASIAGLARMGRTQLNAIPGVEDSAFTCCLPIESEFALPFTIVGRPQPDDKDMPGAGWVETTPGYRSVFHIPLLRGRDFTNNDDQGSLPVALINEAAARKFWPNQNPLGQQIVIGKEDGLPDPTRVIVGVVGNTHASGLSRAPGPVIFVPVGQVGDAMAAITMKSVPGRWVVRTNGDPHSYIGAITEKLRTISGGFAVGNVRTMDDVDGRSIARQSFNMLLLTIFGAMALFLAAIGIYGLMAYSVAQRLQEMGIRMALGADAASIRNLVVWQGMRLTLVGMTAGLIASFGVSRFIASFLFGITVWDPVAFVAVPIVLAGVALLAVWVPATRASRVDPAHALRQE
jgi:putative ABC transport system permease protein